MAFRYLSWILFPLLGCYAVYSLLYLEHKGWYSWVLSMLYGFLLTFGEQAPSPLPAGPGLAPPREWCQQTDHLRPCSRATLSTAARLWPEALASRGGRAT